MPDEGFLRRWARLKSGGEQAPAAPDRAPAAPSRGAAIARPAAAEAKAVALPPPAGGAGTAQEQRPPPTLEDAACLTPEDDFSAFVARGVDKSVQRLALKKLFADPHFKLVDGLDLYMHDYNQAAPLAPEVLASLKHAPDVLSRLFGEPPADGGAAAGQAQAQAPIQADGPAPEAAPAPPSTPQGNA
ncbi:DUF3306 domain-containing protein [Massilia sp. MS-15]|uniref:DUF3306 domain-containing protein n=1 Tax=Massilia sp. MS-15 TaxID=2878200 RepID=UPI001CD4DD26|nr:DUF3306 domain-containing protein [Massilia sp. MS-15]MCA1248008.1 DUF3306 domain-containing protein [Massilia sp. MS-15]